MNNELERRYRSILEQYAELLQEWLDLFPEGQDGLPDLFPPFHLLAVLRDDRRLRGSPNLSYWLVAPNARPDGLRELRDFTKDVERLTIVDPYFFAGVTAKAKDIAREFARTARVEAKTLKSVHIIRNNEKDNKAVLTAIKRTLRDSSVRLTHSSTQEVHDRVWIRDTQQAVVVGTSFNGIGSRAAFILPLPKPDLDAILEFLDKRGLAHRSRRKKL